jgi:hypothetical protein
VNSRYRILRYQRKSNKEDFCFHRELHDADEDNDQDLSSCMLEVVELKKPRRSLRYCLHEKGGALCKSDLGNGRLPNLRILKSWYSEKVLLGECPADRKARGRVLLVVRRITMLPDGRRSNSIRAKGHFLLFVDF